VAERVRRAYQIGPEKVPPEPLILERIA